jgi:hypothetical protein
MWTFEHHHDIATTPDQIWPLYADVANWPLWDPAMERVDLDGSFVTGSMGTMHIYDTGAIAFTLTCVENERRFTTDSPGPGVSIVFDHLLVATADGHTTVTHQVIIDTSALTFLTRWLNWAVWLKLALAPGRLAGNESH